MAVQTSLSDPYSWPDLRPATSSQAHPVAWAANWAHCPPSVFIVGVGKKPSISDHHFLTDPAAKEVLASSAYVKHPVTYTIKAKEMPFFFSPLSRPTFWFLLAYITESFAPVPASFLHFSCLQIHTKETTLVVSHHWFCWGQTLLSYLSVSLTWFYTCLWPCFSAPWAIWQKQFELTSLFKVLLETWESKVFITFFAPLSPDTCCKINSWCQS